MTIKEKLDAERKEREELEQRDREERITQSKIEGSRIKDAKKQVMKSLIEYKPKCRSQGVEVRVNGRMIYLPVEYQTRPTRFADDCPEVDVRSLTIGIGFTWNGSERYTHLEAFEDSFISFVKRYLL